MATLNFNSSAVLVRAGAILAASGAYSTSDVADFLGVAPELVTISTTYTRGTTGGLVLFKVEWKIGGVWVYDTTPSWTLTVSGSTVESPVGVTVIPGPPSSDSSALGFAIVVKVAPGASSMRVRVAEADATKASPGTLGDLYLSARI